MKEISSTVKPAVESRTCPRFSLEMPVLVIARKNGSTQIAPARSADLSESGMSIVVPISLVSGQSVSLEFTVPSTKQLLKLSAVVRHNDRYRCGCEFLDPSLEQIAQFRRLTEMN